MWILKYVGEGISNTEFRCSLNIICTSGVTDLQKIIDQYTEALMAVEKPTEGNIRWTQYYAVALACAKRKKKEQDEQKAKVLVS